MKSISSKLALLAGTALLAACTAKEAAPVLCQADFQKEFAGKQTDLWTIANKSGMEVYVTNFGARIVAIMVPDKDGKMQDAVIGFKNIEDYTTIASDFGSTVGRYANRINQGKITVDGVEYQLPTNNFGHCLHGGCDVTIPQGWQNLVWDLQSVSENSITLVMNAPDMETANEELGIDGFPGNVVATATYTVKEDNSIDIVWKATTDRKTVINMTNHSYFNLNGDHSMPITNHILTLNADNYTPVDATYMTTGEIAPVAGTPMDFTKGRRIGEAMETADKQPIKQPDFQDEQLNNGNGYDHNWVLNTKGDDTKCCAKLYSPVTGIFVEVYTNEPGIQFYSGNFLDNSGNDKQGNPLALRTGCCLETQKFPDSPNKSDLPGWYSAELNPGQEYYSHCIYKFGVE